MTLYSGHSACELNTFMSYSGQYDASPKQMGKYTFTSKQSCCLCSSNVFTCVLVSLCSMRILHVCTNSLVGVFCPYMADFITNSVFSGRMLLGNSEANCEVWRRMLENIKSL